MVLVALCFGGKQPASVQVGSKAHTCTCNIWVVVGMVSPPLAGGKGGVSALSWWQMWYICL